MSAREAVIQAEILLAIGQLPGGLFWRNNTGSLPDVTGRWVSFGLLGSGDIIGCYRGLFVSIEVKRLKGKQRQSQINFEAACIRAGGLYIVARSASEALRGLGVNAA